MTAKYTHDYDAFRVEVLQADFMLEDMISRALVGQHVAEHISPVETGRFASSWVVEYTRTGGAKGNRAEADLINVDPHAPEIELGHDIANERVTYTKTGRRRKPKVEGPKRHVEGAHVLPRATAAMGD